MILLSNKVWVIVILACLHISVTRGYSYCIRIQNPKNNDMVSGTVNIESAFYPNKCNRNTSYYETNELFNGANTVFDKDLIRAIAWHESGGCWQQFDGNGNVIKNINKPGTTDESIDYGLMQVNNKTLNSIKIQDDIRSNLAAGIQILKNKANGVNAIKDKYPNRWQLYEKKYDLQGHTMQDIVLKAYNGFQKSWIYPDAINKVLKQKPWQAVVQISMGIDDKIKDSKQMSLCDSYQYQWDTTPESGGKHSIDVQSIKVKGGAKSQDKIMVSKEDAKWSGSIDGVVIIENDQGVLIRHPFRVQLVLLDDFDISKLKVDSASVLDAESVSDKIKETQTNGNNFSASNAFHKYMQTVKVLGRARIIVDLLDEGTHISTLGSYSFTVSDNINLTFGDNSFGAAAIANCDGRRATTILLAEPSFIVHVVDYNTLTFKASFVETVTQTGNTITEISGQLIRSIPTQ
jgi:hypothetical protein